MRQPLILLLLCACCAHLQGQTPSVPDTGRIIVLSSRVGPDIDPAERQQFDLFEAMLISISGSTRDYRNAVVLELPDSTFRVRFTLARANEPPRDTLIVYSYTLLRRLAQKIDHFEEMKAGTYDPAQHPPPVLSAAGEQSIPKHVVQPTPAGQRGRLPLASAEGFTSPRYYPALNFGFGLRTYAPDLSGLSQVFGKTPGLGLSPLLSGCVEVAIIDAVALQAEGAMSIGGEKCNQLALGGFFYVSLISSRTVQFFVNPSVLLCSFRSESQGIIVKGGGTGFSGTIGIQLRAEGKFAVEAYGGFCSLPTVATAFADYASSTGRSSIPASIKMSSPIFGLRLKF